MNKIGRYTVTGRLGRGGMSTVYKAMAPVTGRTVALKILQPRDDIFVDLVGEERLKEIFIEEARIMGEICHNHVAKIMDCGEIEGVPFIVLEYFAHSMGSLIGEAYQVEKPSRTMSVKKAGNYILQSLRGLERLHFAGIIHRDIKPYNLMITDDDRIKIIDFGLSRVRGEEKMAIPGMRVGSPYYAAPEQEEDPSNADERSDLFSIGVMAYRMVTGQLVQARGEEIIAPSSLNSELTSDWDKFLLKSLSISPDNRFSSAHEMRRQLENLLLSWEKTAQSSCRFLAMDQASPQPSSILLRSAPSFFQLKKLQQSLNLDALMRPNEYAALHFEYGNSDTFLCLDTRLLWQREGSGFTLPWSQASSYIDSLNMQKWQGREDWRLPTTEELHTLLRPPTRLRDFCFESLLSEAIHWLWSSDTCTKKKAWLVDVQECFFHPLDKEGMATVCAVSGPET